MVSALKIIPNNAVIRKTRTYGPKEATASNVTNIRMVAESGF